MGLDEVALDRIRAIGGPVLLGRMAVVFIEDVPKRLDRLRAACGLGDRAMVARMAHSIRGSALSLGGAAAVETCLALELAARTDGADLDAAVADAERAIAELRDALRPLTALAA